MSICNPCAQASAIIGCASEIWLPNIGSPEADVLVYQKNCTTGRVSVAEATSDVNGKIVLEAADFKWMPGHQYEIWVTKNTASNNCDKETFTICETTATCISVSVQSAYLPAGGAIVPSVQVLAFEDCCPEDAALPIYDSTPDGGGGGDAPIPT